MCHPTSTTRHIDMIPHAAIRPCARPHSSQRPLMHPNPLTGTRFSLRRRWLHPESKCDSHGSTHTVPRRVECCSTLEAAIGASNDAVPRGRPAKVGRTASSEGGFWELLRWARVPVESRVRRTKSRFWRPVAARSRRSCEKAFPLEDLVLVFEYLPARRKGGADTAAQQRMDGLPTGGRASYNPSAGLKVGRLFCAP